MDAALDSSMKPLCGCGMPATGTLAALPMCHECIVATLHREAGEAEEILEKIERGEIPEPRAFRFRGAAKGPAN